MHLRLYELLTLRLPLSYLRQELSELRSGIGRGRNRSIRAPLPYRRGSDGPLSECATHRTATVTERYSSLPGLTDGLRPGWNTSAELWVYTEMVQGSENKKSR